MSLKRRDDYVKSPTSDTMLMTPVSETLPENDEKVRMKKQLGLLEGVAIILGIIFGSGIFVSPKGVIEAVNSVGTSLVVWALCGVLSMIGALCYAELGTSIPKSGGDYAYIYEAFGPLLAFLYLWDAMLIFVPTTNAIMGLTFAKYVIQPFFPDCELPDVSVRCIAAVVICFFTFMNCYDVKLTSNIQNSFMFGKIAALVIIIITGIGYLFINDDTSNFTNSFEGGTTDPGKIAVAFYSGIFSYSGWNYLNFMTEELKNPYVNLPRAIYISLPLVTLIYVLANIAYLAVLSPAEMFASNAIAVTFGNRVLGIFAWIMPLMVAMSALGGLSVHIMTSSRMCFVGARYGHFPTMLSHININRFTPTPSLVFLNILSLIMLCTSDIYLLITYSSFVESFFIMLSVSGLLWLRYKKPDMHRPIKVSIWIPVLFVIICIFLVVLPVYVAPLEVGMGIVITLTGVPAYCCGVLWNKKPAWFTNSLESLTFAVQKLFMSAKEEGVEGFD
ncbi:solute carrier family 7 member genderblind [Lycorma delicatula]|uniref:solute carrier family 7 member genderblind n=1 Tax=Lycorma delicatula TaxID=130591 RepID=UPI003F5185B6